MRINHNITALNTYNKLSANQATTAKSLEKLSSGLKINRAGDNAAGLAISEKMRGQIRGLDQASSNASDGISLIKTAEGALNETHSILQRMRELAVQSANDTNTTNDRAEIQKEIDQLTSEVDRISENTEFNTKKLLTGAYGTTATSGHTALKITSSLADTIGVGTATAGTTAATKTTATGTATISSVTITAGTNDTLVLNDTTIKFNAGTYTQQQILDRINEFKDSTGTEATSAAAMLKMDAVNYGDKAMVYSGNAVATLMGTKLTSDSGSNAIVTGLGTTSVDATDGSKLTITNGTFKGMKLEITATQAGIAVSTTKNDLDLQIGANKSQSMSIGLQNMSSSSLGIKGLDVSTATKASAAITTIDDAITSVSSERSKMGAYQNRLEHTINNLGTASENTASAESRIRDVDMAKEMMEFTKSNILSQAAQSMLAQANQQPQGVLQLLQ